MIEIKGRNGRWGLRDSKDGRRSKRRWHESQGKSVSYEEWRADWPDYLNVLSDRNYALFGILAGVRWRFVDPLFGGRGYPDDASKATLRALDAERNEYHSHTYFTVQDLLDAEWNTACHQEKMVMFADDFLEWHDTKVLPSGLESEDHVSSRRWMYPKLTEFHREVTEEEMLLLLVANTAKKLIKTRKHRLGGGSLRLGPYTASMLPRSYRDMVPEFVDVIPSLVKLGPPDQVRVIIAFDN